MKTTIYDYVASTILIFLISICSIGFGAMTFNLISGLKTFAPLISFFCFLLFFGLMTALGLKMLRIFFPFKEGDYSMSDIQFFLWKVYSVTSQLGKPCLTLFTPIFLRPVLYSLFGANIGKQVAIGGKILDPFFTTMENYSIIGEDAIVTAHAIENGLFHLKPVILKTGCTVGVKAFIMPGVEIGENSIVAPGSVVTTDTKIPPNELWAGSPAKYKKKIDIQ